MVHQHQTMFALALALLLSANVFATDYWVAGNGSNGNPGSQSQPFRTISYAMTWATGGDTIKVKSGVYDVNAGESFPIDVKHNVDIIGQEISVANWPQIGGDVNVSSSSVEALLRVQATGANRTGIDVKKLYFVGEDYSGKDAPSAFVVRVSDGHSATVTFEDNFCERSAMNDSSSADRATVLVEAGSGTTNVTVLNCREIGATARAGIEIKNGYTTSTSVADVTITLRGNTVMVTDDRQAQYGVAYIGTGEAWVPAAKLNIAGNTIESRECTGSGGIQTGLYISVTPDGNGVITIQPNDLKIIRNTITECNGDGIWLRSFGLTEPAEEQLTVLELERNNVRGCGGSALFIQKSDSAISSHAGYLNVRTKGNMFVQNYLGVKLIDTLGGGGPLAMVNDTIAYNTSYALQFDGSWAEAPQTLVNAIVWENNYGGTQYGGTSGWTPGNEVTFCDFQGLSSGEGNIDVDPLFVSVANGDFHLDDDPASPCIDAGDNIPLYVTLTEIDIDGQLREQDGDDDETITVDMGADEVPDPNP